MALGSYHFGTNPLQPEPLPLGFATRSPEVGTETAKYWLFKVPPHREGQSSRGSGGAGMGARLRQTMA